MTRRIHSHGSQPLELVPIGHMCEFPALPRGESALPCEKLSLAATHLGTHDQIDQSLRDCQLHSIEARGTLMSTQMNPGLLDHALAHPPTTARADTGSGCGGGVNR
jgi:hypothetical protein